MLGNLEKLLKQVDNRARFLSGVLSGDIQCINRKKNELSQEFMAKGFDPLPKEVQPDVKQEAEERPAVGASDYDYLTSMSVGSFDEEYLQHLLELKRRLESKVGILRKAAPQCLKSEKEPTLLGRTYKKTQSDRDVMVDMAAKDSEVSEAAPRRQRKRTAADSLETSAVLMVDEEEAPELKDQSHEHTESSPKQERKNQRTRRKKRRALDFQGHDESGDGFLLEEIKRIASGSDGIEITHRNRDQGIVAHELAKLSLLPYVMHK